MLVSIFGTLEFLARIVYRSILLRCLGVGLLPQYTNKRSLWRRMCVVPSVQTCWMNLGKVIEATEQEDDGQAPPAGSLLHESLSPSPWSTRYVLLLISVVAQLVSLIITWPLWNVRTEVPHLPVFEIGLPQLSFGWLLILTLALIPFRPRLGILLHFVAMLCACLFDQMRAQPQFLATWILMLSVLGDSWKNYVRWFLCSLWIWAGLHKAISPDWNAHRAFAMAEAIGLDGESWFLCVAVAVAATEISAGLLAWWKPKWGAVGCVLLHVGISIYLSPMFRDWNYSVLPWNLATAVVGCWILWTCDVKAMPRHKLAFAAFMLLPLGFFVGWLDHGYSHVLYSGSIPQGLITRNEGSLELIRGWGELAVPFPNERRTLRQRFELDSEVGDRLHIFEPRMALADMHFIKQETGARQIERAEFVLMDSNSVAGVELDSKRHVFLLARAGARLLKREKEQMVYAIEFKPQHFRPDLMKHLPHLPNLEQIQLSGTSVSDTDLKALVQLPKLIAIGLNDTSVSDQGIEILKQSRSLKTIQVEGTQVSSHAMEAFQRTR